MAILLYAPSLGESIETHDANQVIEIAKKRGDEFRFLQFDWSKTVDDWACVVRTVCGAYNPTETELVGMSLGSVASIVAVAGMKIQPKRLCLLSLSARWKEDLPNLPAAHLKRFSAAQRSAFGKYSFNELATRIKCSTLLTIGSREYRELPTLAVRVHKAAELIPNAKLVVAEDAGHSLRHGGYQKTLEKHL